MQDDEELPDDTEIVDISASIDADAASAMLGQVIDGKYRIERRLARGGMGVVYLAQHVSLDRPVVFKVLSYHLAEDPRAHSRFEREARGLSVLDHPNVVTVHDFGVASGLTYIVMEYVQGENLSQRLRRRGRIPYDDLLPILMQTVDALAAAHDKMVVHRDIKPSNVMVTERPGQVEAVKVLDFGLAKLATNSVDITQGNLVGTVSYLAPEVIKGAEATPASDVYSLGVMFYYLLTGEKPFEGEDDMSVLYQHVNDEPRWLGEMVPQGEAPEEFFHFIHACLVKDPKHRPQTAGELRRMLGEMVSLPSISAFSIDSAMRLPRYTPADRSAANPLRDTHPSGSSLGNPASSPSMTSEHSFIRHRKRQRKRIMVIAFMVFSVGLAVAAMVLKKDADPASVETPPPVQNAKQDPVEPQTKPIGVLNVQATAGAEVAIDGKVLGEAPVELELEPGSHLVTISKSGHKPWIKTIELEADERRSLDVFLQKKTAPTSATKKSAPTATPEPTQPTVTPEPKPTDTKLEPTGRTPEPTPEEPNEDKKLKQTDESGSGGSGGLLSVEEEKGGLLPVEE